MRNENSQSAGASTRRDFLKKATAATAVASSINLLKTPVYGQTQAPSANVLGANSRISVAYIGVGGQGMAHVRSQKAHAAENNIVQVAVCDVSKTRLEEAKKFITEENKEGKGAGGQVDMIKDHRKVCERKDIDAVCVATVDHWHTACSVDAMQSGKHVYVEKPMTRYLGEAFQIYDTVKSTGKILQVGSQGCSDMKWHEAAKWVKEGKIGQLVMCQGSYMRNNPKGEWNYDIRSWCTDADTDWQHWLGPVNKKVGFSADQYFRWRKYYPYCAGLLGDLFPHKLHPYMLATGNPEFPVRVAAIGNKKVHSDKNTPGTPERDVPEIIQLIAEFPSGMVMHITSSSVNETGTQELMRGHKGNLYMAGNRVELKPEGKFAEEIDPETSRQFAGEDIASHEANWFDCIRTGKVPNAGIELAVRVQTVVSLAEMSERLGEMLHFDEKGRKITTGGGKEIKPITYGTLDLS
jgi:predicted dehydrogenase